MTGIIVDKNITVVPQIGIVIFPKMGKIGVMKLASYMAERGVSPEKMAELIGDVTASGVRKWMYDERIPRQDQMRRLVIVTDGLVMPNDFFLAAEDAS